MKLTVPQWNKQQKIRRWSCGGRNSHANLGKLFRRFRT